MVEENLEQETSVQETPEAPQPSEPAQPIVLAPPIKSRFLFVDVAALRAKQLRRGARPRLAEPPEGADAPAEHPHKAERIAMAEVRQGLIDWELPDPQAGQPGEPPAEPPAEQS